MKVDVRGTEIKQNRQEEAQGKYGLHISMGEIKVFNFVKTCTKVAKREDKGQTSQPKYVFPLEENVPPQGEEDLSNPLGKRQLELSRVSGKQSSLIPLELVIKCLLANPYA